MFLFINQSRSPYWQISFEVDGRVTTKSTRTTDRKEAEKKLRDFIGGQRLDFVEKKFLLSNFITEYEAYIKVSSSESYLNRSVKPAFSQLLKFTGDVSIKSLDNLTLEKFIFSAFNKSKYAGYLYLRTLKAAFNRAKGWGYIEKNYMEGFKLPKIQRKHPSFITFDELQNIMDATDRQLLKDIFLFAFLTGMRLSEIIYLTWNNIDLQNGTIQVGSDDFITKSREVRFIPISEPVRVILKRRKLKSSKTEKQYVFHHCGFAYQPDHISHLFKKCARDAGMNDSIRFHTLRASFGSYLLQQGVPISSISKLLGHSSIAVTEKHYVSLTNGNLINAISHFNTLALSDKKSRKKKNVKQSKPKSSNEMIFLKIVKTSKMVFVI